MKTEYIVLAGVAMLWWSRRRPAQASASAPAPVGWLEHAPVNPSDWYGDQWQRMNGGDLFGVMDAKHPVQNSHPATQDLPVGYYIDPTNAGGAFLNANVAPNAYGATVGGDPMQALFGQVPA